MVTWSTVDEIEAMVGAQVRTVRLRANRTAADVATEAGVSTKTIQNLEHGRGSSLTTLVKVLRALDAEGWLGTLAAEEPVSPLALLEAARSTPSRTRASRTRG